MSALISPHGGTLIDLYLDDEALVAEKTAAKKYVSWDLNPRQLCDIELILNGACSPLRGFMNRQDYDSVCQDMRLSNQVLWPIPVTLDVSDTFASELKAGQIIALRDLEGVVIATMVVSDIWQPDKQKEALQVYGTDDLAHPAVDYLYNTAGEYYLGGSLKGINQPLHYDFAYLRESPSELRTRFTKLGWNRVVAFQTRNPMHRAHQELTIRAAKQVEANLLLHPVVGMTKTGDIDHFTRVRCYEHIMQHYPVQTTSLSLLPLAMRMGGPREAVWHAIIRKNYGCTHIIIGRDHAGPGKDKSGEDFYGPYDAQELLSRHQAELGIEVVPFEAMVYVEEKAQYLAVSETVSTDTVLNISGTELRRRLGEGLQIPEWFSYPTVVQELRKTYPPRHEQGFTLFFTGLSGSGKSTLANALTVKLMELGNRRVTLLDGDIVRKNLSSELGFSKKHRDINVRRIGFVAAEITKNGGIAVCAPIAPYSVTRKWVKSIIEPVGGFIEIHVSTPLDVCEQRDRKGMYAKARAGLIKDFTGIDDPYEIPEFPELRIDTSDSSPEEVAQAILLRLEKLGYMK